MKKFALIFATLATVIATTAIAANAVAQNGAPRPETSQLRKEDYRLRMDEVIVIGRDPYWKKGEQPRWDRSKVDVNLKPDKESRLQLFPNYAAEERDEALKPKDPNNATPKIKLFDVKF